MQLGPLRPESLALVLLLVPTLISFEVGEQLSIPSQPLVSALSSMEQLVLVLPLRPWVPEP